MSLTDKIAEKIAGALGWLLLKELRRIASAIERGIDSNRELAGYQPIFAPQVSEDAAGGASAEGDGDAAGSGASDEGSAGEATSEASDYMRLDILEALAAEHNVPITATTDLIALGKDLGWLDASGGLTMLPKTGAYGDQPYGSYSGS